MVSDPDAADGQEARHVGEVGRPLVFQVLTEVAQIGWNLDLQHQDRDRNREHPVAKRLYSSLVVHQRSTSHSRTEQRAPWQPRTGAWTTPPLRHAWRAAYFAPLARASS